MLGLQRCPAGLSRPPLPGTHAMPSTHQPSQVLQSDVGVPCTSWSLVHCMHMDGLQRLVGSQEPHLEPGHWLHGRPWRSGMQLRFEYDCPCKLYRSWDVNCQCLSNRLEQLQYVLGSLPLAYTKHCGRSAHTACCSADFIGVQVMTALCAARQVCFTSCCHGHR